VITGNKCVPFDLVSFLKAELDPKVHYNATILTTDRLYSTIRKMVSWLKGQWAMLSVWAPGTSS